MYLFFGRSRTTISIHTPSKIHPLWIGIIIIGMEIGWVLLRLATEPPIQVFEWFGGWFAGSIYDEAIAI